MNHSPIPLSLSQMSDLGLSSFSDLTPLLSSLANSVAKLSNRNFLEAAAGAGAAAEDAIL